MYEKIEKFFYNKWNSRISAIIVFFLLPFILIEAFRTSWHIVFGDLDFGFLMNWYIDRIKPLINEIWSTGTFFNRTRLPFVWIIYYILKLFWDYPSLLEKSIIFLLIFISWVWMFFLVYEILSLDKENKKSNLPAVLIFFISLWSWFYYSYNPWFIIRIQHIYLLVWYALLPFLYYKILSFSERTIINSEKNGKWISFFISKKDIYHITLASIIYVIIIWAVHYLFFSFFLILWWYIYTTFYIIFKRKLALLFNITLRYIICGILFLVFVSYWLMPYIWANIADSTNPPSINTIDSVHNLSRYSTLKNVLYLQSYWWPMIDIDNLSFIYWLSWWIIIWIIFLGNVFNLKNKYVLFFSGWSIVFLILSTWTRTPYFAWIYKWIVFDNALAGKIWFIFRDANKLVWLLAFWFAILWWTWVASIFNIIIDKIRKKELENKYLERLFDNVIYREWKIKKIFGFKKTKLRLNIYNLYFIFFAILSIWIFYNYTSPFINNFFGHFYKSIPIPQDYQKLIESQKNENKNDLVLYLPRYESITTPGYEFWIANWNLTQNPQRPTSSFDIYSTQKKTYNPLEWSITYLWHFYEYLDYYINNNIWNNLAKYLSNIWVKELIYHKDLYKQEDIQQKQLDFINKAPWLKLEKQIWFWSFFKIDNPTKDLNKFENSIFLFSGLKKLESIFNIDKYPMQKFANIFVNEDPVVNNWSNILKNWDILETAQEKDLLMSLLEKKEYLVPFDFNNYSDPYSRWAKLKEDIPDWKYHLKKIWITNWNWDFSLNKWFIFTYSPAMLDIEPYKYIHDLWKNIVDFKKIENLWELFSINDKDNIHLVLEKTDKYNEIPAVKWEIEKWNSPIWKVAESKTISVKEKMAYSFEVILSWIWVNWIHWKVKFLDEKLNEIGLNYVSAPRNVENFNLIKFSWNFITPTNTKFIKFDLNSLQKPEKMSYWWIHNMNLKELEVYTKPNIQKTTYDFQDKWKYNLFIRIFENIKWWKLKITIDKKDYFINSKTLKTNSFKWDYLWKIEINKPWKKEITIENIDWFNAINVIWIIKDDRLIKIKNTINWELKKDVRQLITIEPEIESNYYWWIQTNYFDKNYSNWKTTNFEDWVVINNLDIIKNSEYKINIKLNKNQDLLKNDYRIYFFDIDRKKVILDKLYKNINNNIIPFEKVNLKKWQYRLEIFMTTNIKSLLNVNNLKRAPKEKELPKDKLPIKEDSSITEWRISSNKTIKNKEYLSDEKWCTYFAWLEDNLVKYDNSWNTLNIDMKLWNSCYWLVTDSPKIEIKKEKEYKLSYDIKKTNTKKLHSKLVFFDKNNSQISIKTLMVNWENQISNQLWNYDLNKKDWLSYHEEFLVKMPPNAQYVQIQFWQKQRQDIDSNVKISNLKLYEYSKLAWIDSIVIADNKIFDNKKVDAPNSTITQVLKTYSPLWQNTKSLTHKKPLLINLFLNWYYQENKDDDLQIVYFPNKFVMLWYWVTITSIITIFLFIFWEKLKYFLFMLIRFLINKKQSPK